MCVVFRWSHGVVTTVVMHVVATVAIVTTVAIVVLFLPIPCYSAVHLSGGLCIADEVQYGCGRIGSHVWAFQQHGMCTMTYCT